MVLLYEWGKVGGRRGLGGARPRIGGCVCEDGCCV